MPLYGKGRAVKLMCGYDVLSQVPCNGKSRARLDLTYRIFTVTP